jgi:hypothetical protein
LSDQLCQLNELGYDVNGPPDWKLEEDPAWAILTREFPTIANTDPAQFLMEMEQFIVEARKLVRSILRA